MSEVNSIIEHFYRHEYSRLVSILTSRVGVQYFDQIEDAVQAALVTSSHTWLNKEIPTNPTAWLYRVSYNNLLTSLKTNSNREKILSEKYDELPSSAAPAVFFPDEINDSMLHTLFLCCHPALSERSQLVFALKVLCGFSIHEISSHLLDSEASINKRYTRAKSTLKQQQDFTFDSISPKQQAQRLNSVHRIISLVFTEGYLSQHDHIPIRKDLCLEAIRLANLLTQTAQGNTPQTYALLSLMHLQYARFDARIEAENLVLLQEQNRRLWDYKRINLGLEYLVKSAEGEQYSSYHAEAKIAAEYCTATSYQQTRWHEIIKTYELLMRVSTVKSPFHTLNYSIALVEGQQAERALKVLAQSESKSKMQHHYLWNATLAYIQYRLGNNTIALQYKKQALASAPSSMIHSLLVKRLCHIL